jgi:hypothetical protein
MPKAEAGRAAPDFVPLHERLKEYAREKAIQASDGKVVEMSPSDDDRRRVAAPEGPQHPAVKRLGYADSEGQGETRAQARWSRDGALVRIPTMPARDSN